jgi:uncharacterized membrane protein YhaH (DUF805 family)
VHRDFFLFEKGGTHQTVSSTLEVMKKLVELLLCILHPLAVVLIWINLAARRDLDLIPKLTWAIAALIPFVPFVYVLTGNDFI